MANDKRKTMKLKKEQKAKNTRKVKQQQIHLVLLFTYGKICILFQNIVLKKLVYIICIRQRQLNFFLY